MSAGTSEEKAREQAIEDGAKILADWIGYAWDGLNDRDISAEFKDWAYNGIGTLTMQGGRPALRKVAAKIIAKALADRAVEDGERKWD